MSSVFRNLPSLSELLESPPLKRMLDSASHNAVVSGVQNFLDQVRGEIRAATEHAPNVSDLAERIAQWIAGGQSHGTGPMVNATGVLLAWELGGVPLAPSAIDRMAMVGAGYCGLTTSVGSARLPSLAAAEAALARLAGAEAALAVSGEAAALMLALSVATGREVLVARSDVADVGRTPLTTICQQSGVRLKEVGATHRTAPEDFRDAFHADSAAVLRVVSNRFQISGDFAEPSLEDLIATAHRRNLPCIVSLESGALVDYSPYGLRQLAVPQAIAAGADLVVFAGDQLMGGPRAGLIVGRRTLIQQLRHRPLAGLLGVSKCTLAALEATLDLYAEPKRLEESLPIVQLLSTSLDNLRQRAERLAPQICATEHVADAVVEEGNACLVVDVPGQRVPSCRICVTPQHGDSQRMAEQLRHGSPSVAAIARAKRVELDLRAVAPAEDERLLEAFRNLSNN